MRALPHLILLATVACQSRPSQGVEQYALSVSLARPEAALAENDGELTGRLAQRCAADLAGTPGLRAKFGEIVDEALGRARVRARNLPSEKRSDALAILAGLGREQIQVDWRVDGFDRALAGTGMISQVKKVAKGTSLPKLGPGKTLHVEVRAQIAMQMPGAIAARANVTWWSQEGAAQIVAQSLAAVLAERMARYIEVCAQAEGLVVRRSDG